MKPLTLFIVTLVISLSFGTAHSDVDKKAAWKERQARSRYIHKTRPRRLDVPLRTENISDEEVRQIQAVTSSVFPGAIANISGVTAGCPCEEGPQCNSQVWVVAYRDSRYDGLMLSKVDDTWAVGLIQQWWFRYERLRGRIGEAIASKAPDKWDVYRRLLDEQTRLQETFPACAPINLEDSQPHAGVSN